ncbi:CobQ/CobB/MinD/ParA nucleotide binding domain protein [Acididesulfobacillus acetoxydans]|uniref:4Fe-4S binding domain protein n=1 Tax=Acididesulfobacillus acetoxydans TaxID=1561005 RepID=A0A8S0VW55_9FIRM|nr:ATP-binding protein [Acididesulfobacillus acetoxydans]CAA7600443.1 CobQ/CobB/MinD/ParA nucleotide binding domain protein [Acididesulfobacillus acetoxydans]CEJ06577.1 4Fe-4S binding domain protein [Acididesulfobacillus acetoxydans]
MRIGVLSGKGGTGKTTVAVNLALSFAQTHKTQYLDYDVEEPNGFLFLQPEVKEQVSVPLLYPEISDKCTLCGECSKACQYHALAQVSQKVLVFPELCHGCGTCSIVCRYGAVLERERPLGLVELGYHGNLRCVQGILREGEALAVPVIQAVRSRAEERSTEGFEVTVADCPPGSSCSVIHSVEASDLALLVTEPTAFGLHDLKIAVRLVRELGLRHGVVLNKDDGSRLIRDYCGAEDIPLMAAIPFDIGIAKTYSKGLPLLEDSRWAVLFADLRDKLVREVPVQKHED